MIKLELTSTEAMNVAIALAMTKYDLDDEQLKDEFEELLKRIQKLRTVAPQPKRTATMTDKEYLPTDEALDYTGRSRSTLYRNLKPARGGFGCIPSLWDKRDLDLLIARYSVEGVGDER